ncbi:hypothetical protein [Propionivibrio sp.]|uniref:hypothetical protein n=1 Tax=Propionivibrio sp. TaxID=2212460 RepID=UPI003BF315D2
MKTARVISGSGLMLALLFVGQMVQAAEPVAMVTDLTGNAWLRESGKEKRLDLLSYLDAGASIRLDGQAAITITLFSPAAEYVANGPARLELAAAEVRRTGGGTLHRRSLDERRVNAAQRLFATQRERLTLAAYEMKALPPGLQLLAPVHAESLTLRPVFKWSAPLQSTRYAVTLVDQSDGVLLAEATVSEPVWQLPANLLLQHQHRYSWEVRSSLPDGREVSAAAEFSIVDEARSVRILQQAPSANATFSERVLYAALLESEGLSADDEWRRLAAERPDEPLLAIHLNRH